MRIRLVHLPRTGPVELLPRGPWINILPLGLPALADALERAGHDVQIWHAGLEGRLDARFELGAALAEDRAELVGLGLHWHAQLLPVEQALGAIRAELPRVPVVLGGLTASWFAEEILRDLPGADFVLRGEAERPLVELAALLARGAVDLAAVPNLSWRRAGERVHNPLGYVAGRAELDALDFSRVDLVRHAERYNAQFASRDGRFENPPVFYLSTGRGCSRACAFCGGGHGAHRAAAGRTEVTFRSTAVVAAEMERLVGRGIRDFCVCFDPPPDSHAYYLELFGEVRRRRLEAGLVFECYQPPGEGFLESLAQTFPPGRSRVSFSPTVHDEALRARLLGFGYSNEALEQALERAAGLGLAATLYFAAVPQESEEQLERSLAWQAGLARRFGCRLVHAAIEAEPGAPWCEAPEAFGLGGVRRGFAAFRARHAHLGQGLSAEAEVGYRFPGLDARLVRVRSALGAPLRDLAQALGGSGLGTEERILLAAPARLEEALLRARPWRGLPSRVHLAGDEALRREPALLTRLAEALGPATRLAPFAPDTLVHLRWDGLRPVPPGGQGLVVLHPADPAAAARALARERLGGPGWILGELCRWLPAPCPARTARLLALGHDGALRACGACPGLQARDVAALARELDSRLAPLEARRGCARCPVADTCSRCLFTHPLREEEFCALRVSLGSPGAGPRGWEALNSEAPAALGWDG